MRDKERYVAYEIRSNANPGYNADKLIVEQVKVLLGVFMAPKANATSMKYNHEKQRGISRINRKFVDCLRTCFAMIKHINNNEVLVRTVKVSGMISKVKKYLE